MKFNFFDIKFNLINKFILSQSSTTTSDYSASSVSSEAATTFTPGQPEHYWTGQFLSGRCSIAEAQEQSPDLSGPRAKVFWAC